jgi:hypothetical protein
MRMLTELADVLRAEGLPVREAAGWKTRGHGAMGDIYGVLLHHTAGPRTGNYPSESVVVHGRPDLDGPLANLGLARDGTWIVIAAGQAWHAGTGSTAWCPANTGNTHLIGVEAESCGTRDDWTDAQRGSYPRGVAALLRHYRLPASRAIGHKEWAPGRKIDPAFWDMTGFRSDVARWLAAARPAPPDPYLEDDDVYLKCESVKGGPIWVGLLSGGVLIGPLTPGEIGSADLNINKYGALVQWVERPTWDRLAARS